MLSPCPAIGWITCAASPISATRSATKARATDNPSGKARRGPTACDLAEMQAEALFELGVKAGIVERDDAFGLAGLFGPDDRGAMPGRVALERQDRERPRRQEVLLGAAVVVALMAHGGDDAGLAVAPAVGRDAGALADRRARAVGGDQQPRVD